LVKEGAPLVLSEFHIPDELILDIFRKALEKVYLVERNLQKYLQRVIIDHDMLLDQIIERGVNLKQLVVVSPIYLGTCTIILGDHCGTALALVKHPDFLQNMDKKRNLRQNASLLLGLLRSAAQNDH
jgi:hypothetical protein